MTQQDQKQKNLLTIAQETAMQKLLAQLKEERRNLPMNVEWARCYQAIEMVIETTYLPMEKEQIIKAFDEGQEYEYESFLKFL